MSDRAKILSLESLRGIAAISVIFYHLNLNSHFNNAFTRNAWLMVDFFFILSGFVISFNYLSRIRSGRDLFQFQYKRFLRLYPLHIVMLLVFLGIEIAKYTAEVKLGLVSAKPAFTDNNLSSFIAHLFLIHEWIIPESTWNGLSWSISAEFYTYAIFGVIALLVAGSRPLTVVISILLVLVTGGLLLKHGFMVPNLSGPARCVYAFFLGVLAFIIFSYASRRGKLGNSLAATLCLVLSVLIVASIDRAPSSISLLIVPPIFALTVFMVASTDPSAMVNRVLGRPELVFLGTVSYGIYLIHGAVLWVLNQTMRFVFKVPVVIDAQGSTFFTIENPYLADAILLLTVAMVIGIAHLSYVFIEKPLQYKPKKATPLQAAE